MKKLFLLCCGVFMFLLSDYDVMGSSHGTVSMHMCKESTMQRLYRSRTERKIAGVCGGVANYFEVDPTLVRLLWALATFFGGAGVIMYVLAWIIMPLEPWYTHR